MSQKHLGRIVVGAAVCMGLGAGAFAQDWPQWRGPARDGSLPEMEMPDAWPATLNKAWTVDVGRGVASPALVGGKLYSFTRQGDQEIVLCLDATNGNEIWRFSYQEETVAGGGARNFPGPRCSPSVANGKVVTIGLAGVVNCLDAETGKLVWSKDPYPDTYPMFLTGSSPVIADGTAIAYLGKGDEGALIAYDLANGDEKWRWTGVGPEYSSPVVAEIAGVKQVVVLSTKTVAGVALDGGQELWKHRFEAGQRAQSIATPIVQGDTVIFTVGGSGCHALHIEKGEPGFSVSETWLNTEAGTRFSTATASNGKLYLVNDQGRAACLDAATGKTIWAGEEQIDRMGFASIVATGSVMSLLAPAGELVVFDAQSSGYEELARYKVADSSTYAHPIPGPGGVFIKDESTLSFWTGQ